MSDTEALDDFIYSLAQTIILLGPTADPRREYAASDICQHLNPSRISRRHPEVVYESDLETGLSELRIRNSLKSIFPSQLEFHQNTVGRGDSKKHFYKIKFLVNPDVRAFTIDSLAAAINVNIKAEKSKKRTQPQPQQPHPHPPLITAPPLLLSPPPISTIGSAAAPAAPAPFCLLRPLTGKRKRGGQPQSREQLLGKIHNLQRTSSLLSAKNSELKCKLKLLPSPPAGSRRVGVLSPYCQQIKELGAWKDSSGALTISAGLLMSQLRAIGISEEKLPIALSLFHCLYQRQLNLTDMQYLIPSTAWASLAMERNAELVSENMTLFLESNSVVGFSINQDESSKKKAPLLLKPISVQEADGRVTLTALTTHISATAKADAGAEHVFQSMIDQLGDSIRKCDSGTADWCHKGKLPRQILKLRDAYVASQEALNPGSNKRTSRLVEGLEYDSSGEIAQYRLFNCQPHMVERGMEKLLLIVGGKSGLNYEATTTQGLFRAPYYVNDALKETFYVIAAEMYSPDLPPDELLDCIGTPNLTRWLTLLRSSDNAIKALNIEANESMFESLGISADEEVKMRSLLSTCADDGKLSAFMIALCKLADACPGGRKGTARIGVSQTIGMFGSTEHRIALTILQALLPFERSKLAFYNGKSEIFTDSELRSNRVLELPVFERNFMQEVSLMTHSIWEWNPQLKADLVRISKRLGSDSLSATCVDYWEKLINEGVSSMLPLFMEYIMTIHFNIGLCMAWLTDRVVGPLVACGILRGLAKFDLITYAEGLSSTFTVVPLTPFSRARTNGTYVSVHRALENHRRAFCAPRSDE